MKMSMPHNKPVITSVKVKSQYGHYKKKIVSVKDTSLMQKEIAGNKMNHFCQIMTQMRSAR